MVRPDQKVDITPSTPFLEAFGIQAGETVAIAGSGGKATLMYRLASEAVGRGYSVLTTSTTHLHPPTSLQTNGLYVTEDLPGWLQVIPEALNRQKHVTVLSARPRPDKLRGLSLEDLDRLKTACRPDICLIKADGARTRLFKAPGDHEPVAPAWTDHAIIVVSLRALELTLNEKEVHRPDRVSAITGLAIGAPIDASVIAQVVSHPSAYFKAFHSETRMFLYVSCCSEDQSLLHEAGKICDAVPEDTFTGILCGDITRSGAAVKVLR